MRGQPDTERNILVTFSLPPITKICLEGPPPYYTFYVSFDAHRDKKFEALKFGRGTKIRMKIVIIVNIVAGTYNV